VSSINAYDTPWIEKSSLSLREIDTVLRDVHGFLFPILFEPHAGKIADVLRSIDTALQTSLWLACVATIGTNFTVACPSGTPKYLQIRSAKSRSAEPLKNFFFWLKRGPAVAVLRDSECCFSSYSHSRSC